MAVTIHSLVIQLDVEGSDDEAVFTRLFNQHIQRWDRRKHEQLDRQRMADAERRLTGPDEGEEA
jgi:hypothetical protein